MKKYDATIEGCRKLYQKAVTAEDKIRRNAEEQIAFEDGEQWGSRDKAQREDDGRPCLVINKVAGIVKQVVGDARKTRPRIKVRGVDNQSDPQKAEVFTGLIRSIENQSDAESAYDWGVECAARSSFGWWKIITDYADDDVFDQDIQIERVTNQFSIYLDPSHRKPTGEDANWLFELQCYESVEDFETKYPGKDPASWDVTGLDVQSTSEQVWTATYWWLKPRKKELFQTLDGKVIEVKKPKTQAVETEQGPIEYVYGENLPNPIPFRGRRTAESHSVQWQVMSGSEILEKGEWAGKYLPFVRVIGEEVWIKGERYLRSSHQHSHDAQRLYNWSRSNSAETLGLAPRQPFLATPEEVEGHEQQWAVANRKPMAYLLHNDAGLGRPARQPATLQDIGAINEASMASDDIKATTGIYDASMGAQGNETSGVAIRERKAEGDNATFVFHDNLYKSVRYTGKILVDLIPRIYDTERVVRILTEDDAEAWVMINQLDPMTGETLMDLTVGKYDLVMDTGPSYQTARVEAADGMLRFMQSFPKSSMIIAPRLAKVLDWPDAAEIADELQQLMQGGPSPEDEMEAQKNQLDIEGKQLVNEKRKLDILQDLEQMKAEMYQTAQQAIMDTLGQMMGVR